MPVHDWTKVPPGIFHDFHVGWIVALSRVLNNGGLPEDCCAMLEPRPLPATVGRRIHTRGVNGSLSAAPRQRNTR
jgi:hypothetical protein